MAINKFIPAKSGLEQLIVFLYCKLNLFYMWISDPLDQIVTVTEATKWKGALRFLITL